MGRTEENILTERRPTVGIVVPVRNMARTLERSLQSACEQAPDRIVVVDDASEDETPLVAAKFAEQFPFVEYVRWETKQECHVSALEPVYDSLDCDQVIGLAADDILLPGLIDVVRDNAEHAVIFTHYSFDVVGDIKVEGVVQHPYEETTVLSPQEMCERIRTQPAVETGIGSSIRKDVRKWLSCNEWQVLGPHQDSIGYATAAAIYGCVYVPTFGAHIYFNPQGYGQSLTDKFPDLWVKRVREFAARAGLDPETCEALVQKRCFYEIEEQYWYQQTKGKNE
jgi:glycosyltransferase involved in cell wall biosynthesis